MVNIPTIVFDLDGTLADTSADLLAAANACFDQPLLGPTDALTAFLGGRAMLRLGYQRLGREWSEADVDRDYPRLLAAYADGICVQTRLYPGVVAAVEGLRRQGYATAICTNKRRAIFNPASMSCVSSRCGSLINPFQPIVVRGFSK